MKRYIMVFTWAALILFYPVTGQCLKTDFQGRLESNFVLRDTDGFQYGFLDNTKGVQWRNLLKFDVTLTPEYTVAPSLFLDKVFLSYRGAYDAIFELTDRYDTLAIKSPDDFELGKDDVEWENDLREAFVDLVAEQGMQKVTLRLGRQIVQWGEADGFNLINIICPDDYSYQMFFSDIDDLATPLWMARLNYSSADLGPFSSVGLELLAIPDIRPDQYAPLTDENGNFTSIAPYGFVFSDFDGYSQWSVEQFVDPVIGFPTWPLLSEAERIQASLKYTEADPPRTFDNMEYGVKLEATIGSFLLALHYFVGFQDEPAVDTSDTNRFIVEYYGWLAGGASPVGPTAVFTHPRQRTYGLSFNCWVDRLGGIIRGEGSITDKTHLAYTNSPKGDFISSHKVYQSLIAFDKDYKNLEKWIGTTTNLSTALQFYWRHIAGLDDGERFINPITLEDLGRAYPYDLHDSYRITLTMYTDYHHGQIFPQIFAMYDPEGTWMTNASIKYDPDGRWLFLLTQQSFWGNTSAVSPFAPLIGTSELSFKVMYRF